MMLRTAIVASAVIAALGAAEVLGQEEDKDGAFGLDVGDGLHYSWDEIPGAEGYHVQGEIPYRQLPLCPTRSDAATDLVTFDEDLPAGTTTYTAPGPEGERMTFTSIQFMIEALDASGSVIARDGFVSTSDPFCTPEEIAATGTGFAPPDHDTLRFAGAALAATGAFAICSALALRRRTA